MSTPLLKASGLGRTDQGRIRLVDFNLCLERGEIVGLLGVNGAGKSTALALLSGSLAPSRGEVQVLGKNLHGSPRARRHIGLLPERAPLYPQLSVQENLDFAGRLRGLRGKALSQARKKVVRQLDLGSFQHRLCSRLSRGMAQRTAIAQALIHEPEILILDEPTAGLDPSQAQELRDLIGQVAPARATLLASHILEDMEQLCGRVKVLNQGRQVARQHLDDTHSIRVHLSRPPAQGTDFLLQLPGISQAQHQGDGWYQLALTQPVETLAPQLAPWGLLALIPARYSLQSLLTENIS
ncbi:ABC transporter ATP-binding protein [Thiolapillus brandeum]|uniref:ABC-2 type transporter ATP-binding protein n=1 Tax=Thiolapillus brandeum TaxID=1076588 RepID=A0A7U6GKI1_9GAMM|nr:ABC transporter ATP-binding protein [Thiolapillus brandeum]BAO45224.1 ABC-2 type transporter ATP-binding protein [Thiolapillus brandeum]